MKVDLNKKSPIKQPHEYIHDGFFISEIEHEYSVDPLINYRFNKLNVDDDYQIYVMPPKEFITNNKNSFNNLIIQNPLNIEVVGPGEIMIDFGAEFPAWLEIDSPDLTGEILLGVSEFKQKSNTKKC